MDRKKVCKGEVECEESVELGADKGQIAEEDVEMGAVQERSAKQQIEELLGALEDEEFLERYIYNNSEICSVIIGRYLMRLKGLKGVTTLGAGLGACAVAAVKRPRTLEEAKAFVDKL